jgi:hypothetical protein
MQHQRTSHYLDRALNTALDLPREKLPGEVAVLLINLCGAVRHLERENADLRAAMTQRSNSGALEVERGKWIQLEINAGAAA